MIRKDDVNVEAGQRLKDFGLVAALVSAGFAIERTERDFRTVYFVFSASTALNDAISAYWANTLIVSARQYFDNTKMLKSRIYGVVNATQ
jgi:hypothetical protein